MPRMKLVPMFVAGGLLAYTPFASAQSPAPFVPIIIDEAKANWLVERIGEISMPNKAYQQVIRLLQDLETQAQAQAEAAKSKLEK